jgi:EipB-like
MNVRQSTGAGRAVALAVMAGLICPAALAQTAPVKFAPHRAVYDVTLVRSAPGSGVSDMSGRLVYELTGGECEGYSQSMRFVTQSSSSDGSEQVNDMRSSSFEETAGKRLRFTTTQLRDDQVAEVTQGQAGRRAPSGDVTIELVQPEPKAVSLKGKIYFPIQHSLALIDAARAGQQRFEADVYDGSEKGDKVSATTTIIGKGRLPTDGILPPKVVSADRLKPLRYWPITTSYFEKDKTYDKKDALPSYEMAAQFFENGVSNKLMMDYGDFALRGDLTELTFLEEPACAAGK